MQKGTEIHVRFCRPPIHPANRILLLACLLVSFGLDVLVPSEGKHGMAKDWFVVVCDCRKPRRSLSHSFSRRRPRILLLFVSLQQIPIHPSTDAKKQAAYCENLAKTIKSVSDLPDKCKDYDAVKLVLQKRKTVTDPFAGMKGATAARANRTAGVESHAKIQRRMTSGATVGARRFSKLDK